MGPCMAMSFETLCPVTQWPRFCFNVLGVLQGGILVVAAELRAK